MFWLFSCCLGPLSRHGNSAPWAYIVVSLQQCSFFLTLRGNFGADSNNFGPCPSHAFRLSELQSLTDLLLYPVVVWANRGAFDSYKWVKSPALRPDSMARTPAPETTSCFAASVDSPCSMSPSLSGVNHDLILCTECTMIYSLVVSFKFFTLQYVT